MLESILLAFGFAQCAFAASCTLTAPQHLPHGRHCGSEGQLSGEKTALLRKFQSFNNATYCINECITQSGCLSVSHDTAKNVCSSYAENVKNQGFMANGSTQQYYYSRKCLYRSGDCGVENPSFEIVTKGEPAGHNGVQSIDFFPWRYVTTTDDPSPTPKVISNEHSLFPTPFGNRYLQVVITRDSGTFFQQDVTLEKHTKYNLTYASNFQSYKGGDNATAHVKYGLGGAFLGNTFIGKTFSRFPSKGHDDGIWRTDTSIFTTGRKPTNSLSIDVFQSGTTGLAEKAVFGFDSITIEKV